MTAEPSVTAQPSIDGWLGKVHCGDAVTVLDAMPVGSVDLVVTSPPYNIKNSTGNGLKNGKGGKWRVQKGLWQRLADEITDGFPVRQIIIWQRAGGINFNPGYFLPTYEVIYMIAKPAFRLAKGASALGDVWTIPQEANNPHPAPFPVELAQRCIASTNASVVLDPFIGSGTTAIAAICEARSWLGIDVSQTYCEMARERIAQHRR